MRTCDEISELISAGLDGVLTVEEEQELSEHLASCPACAALADDLAGIHALMPGLNEEPPAFIMDNVMARIRVEKSEPIPFPVKKANRRVWRAWGATAAALVLVAAAGYFALQDFGPKGGSPAGLSTTVTAASATPPTPLLLEREAEDVSTGSDSLPEEPAAVPGEKQVTGEAVEDRKAGGKYSNGLVPGVSSSGGNDQPPIDPQSPAPSPSVSISIGLFNVPLTAVEAAMKLYEGKLAEEWSGAVLVDREDFIGYVVPGMQLRYIGLTRDGAAFEFEQSVDGSETVIRYVVPTDGSEIQTMDE